MARRNKNIKGRGYLCPDTDATYSWYVEEGTNSIFSELKLRDRYKSISLGFDSIPQGKKTTKKNLRKEVQGNINKIKVLERQLAKMKREILKAEKSIATKLKKEHK